MIELDEVDGITVVRLAHGKVNALDLELLERITATFTALDTGPAPAIVLTGTGRAFSAGVDLWRIIDGGAAYVHAFLPALEAAFLAVFTVGKPVVAALNGHAIAGGAILAAGCDHRIMADGAGTIGVTELRVGVPFPASALEILGHAYGEPQARRQIIAADTLGPAAALAAGRVDELSPPEELLKSAVATARRLAAQTPADTFRLTKQQLQATARRRLATRPPDLDPQVSHLWVRAAEDGRLRDYMAAVGNG
ncbi:enoyl-CoA hydratase [Actinoplanes ianthinogenes]|uniref:Enoyl-CoA hydratase n=1 Tax=Actinoplanes ianthinogenes TaxID=122358 RepID=A0ABM7M6B3_9ACTN|nr:enoyl-CoA hydratase/isomerase family protein [Actinoplanes ianthinogenes]BCJ47198.1 enoyl-CoA hydratase [Actinoplanes ianthinogenes]GGR42732.1 enoyl-CoA hydratase [Actinoplanes ianthinogenes]